MFDSVNSIQLLLAIMIVLIGVILLIVGIQLFFVLKDVRKSLVRTERILADMEQITAKLITEQEYVDDILSNAHSLIGSVSTVGRLVGPASIGMSFLKAFSSMLHKQRENVDE